MYSDCLPAYFSVGFLAGSNILIICSWRYTANYVNKYSVTEYSFTHNR